MKRRLPRFLLRAVLLLVAVYALFMGYRMLAVYRYRPGVCAEAALPRPARRWPPPQARTLRVASYNIEGQAALVRSGHLAGVAAAIRDLDADVVGLQEVHRGTWQARFRDQPRLVLAALPPLASAFGTSYRSLGGEFGNALLTRGTIEETTVLPLPGIGEPRSVLRARVVVEGLRFEVYVTHLTAWGAINRRVRVDQVRCLREHLAHAALPYILVGDLNAGPDAPEIRPLLASSGLTLCGAASEVTHPLLRRRIDYILLGPGWEVVRSEVVHRGPSDHWPIVADVRWRGEAAATAGEAAR